MKQQFLIWTYWIKLTPITTVKNSNFEVAQAYYWKKDQVYTLRKFPNASAPIRRKLFPRKSSSFTTVFLARPDKRSFTHSSLNIQSASTTAITGKSYAKSLPKTAQVESSSVWLDRSSTPSSRLCFSSRVKMESCGSMEFSLHSLKYSERNSSIAAFNNNWTFLQLQRKDFVRYNMEDLFGNITYEHIEQVHFFSSIVPKKHF